MSKILDATCDQDGKVTADGVEVPAADVTVLSEGKQDSSGLLFMQGDKARYLPSSATDIKTTIEKLVSILQDVESALSTIASTLTDIGAGMTGSTTAPPPSLPTNVTSINTKISEIATVRGELNTLKGALK